MVTAVFFILFEFIFVGKRLNNLLIPKLHALRPGVRIICHHFELPGVVPDEVVKVTSKKTDREHVLYRYTTPLMMKKDE